MYHEVKKRRKDDLPNVAAAKPWENKGEAHAVVRIPGPIAAETKVWSSGTRLQMMDEYLVDLPIQKAMHIDSNCCTLMEWSHFGSRTWPEWVANRKSKCERY